MIQFWGNFDKSSASEITTRTRTTTVFLKIAYALHARDQKVAIALFDVVIAFRKVTASYWTKQKKIQAFNKRSGYDNNRKNIYKSIYNWKLFLPE